jgi:CRP-like cAMP-binding protein
MALEEIGPGSIFGLAECFLGTTYQFDALAVEPCGLLRFGRGSLQRLLLSGEATDVLFRSLAQENIALRGRLDSAGVGERIAAYLLSRSEGTGKTRVVRTTQERIASAVGAARETVNRRLQDLERAGVLETGRGEILVYRLDELARMAGG